MKQRKTDYGTVILHWLLIGAFAVAFLSGLRIASEAPGRTWINQLDAVLPRESVWVAHMQAAVVLVTVALAYIVYLARSGLGRRVKLDRIRLRGLFGRGQARMGAINTVLIWIFFITMLALMASGGLLYFGIYAGYDVAMLHWWGTWIIVGFAGFHVLAQHQLGGLSQLLRIFRPTNVPARPARLDAVELLTMLVEQSARLPPEAGRAAAPDGRVPTKRSATQQSLEYRPAATPNVNVSRQRSATQQPPESRPAATPNLSVSRQRSATQQPPESRPAATPDVHASKQRSAAQQPPESGSAVTPNVHASKQRSAAPQPPESGPAAAPDGRVARQRRATLQSNAFAVAAAVAITGASALIATDRLAVDYLEVHRINASEAPVLDGDTSDRAWRNITPFSLMTSEGGNFDGKGESRIEIRAVHDDTFAYFLFTWEDPTRSLKHLPLIKEVDGWHMLHEGFEVGDEHEFNEDKFSVLLTTSDVVLAGDRTFHAGPHPIPGAPATMTGRGLHFTTTGGYADVWQWKATSGGPTGWMDDAHFGPPLQPTPEQAQNLVPYKGGFAPDPGTANYSDNFMVDGAGGSRIVAPRRLPRDLATTTAAMGDVDIDPNHGEGDGTRWYMTEQESMPYSAELDARIPTGTVIPGVIIAGDFTGDRADVRSAARWASGHWALEVARRLDTGSMYDVPIKTGVFMRVAAFDHSQIRHTRHVRPIRLEVE